MEFKYPRCLNYKSAQIPSTKILVGVRKVENRCSSLSYFSDSTKRLSIRKEMLGDLLDPYTSSPSEDVILLIQNLIGVVVRLTKSEDTKHSTVFRALPILLTVYTGKNLINSTHKTPDV